MSLRDAVAYVLVCNIVVNEFELQSGHNVHFQTNTFGKGMKPLSRPHYYYCSPTRMDLALNNPRGLICHKA